MQGPWGYVTVGTNNLFPSIIIHWIIDSFSPYLATAGNMTVFLILYLLAVILRSLFIVFLVYQIKVNSEVDIPQKIEYLYKKYRIPFFSAQVTLTSSILLYLILGQKLLKNQMKFSMSYFLKVLRILPPIFFKTLTYYDCWSERLHYFYKK